MKTWKILTLISGVILLVSNGCGPKMPEGVPPLHPTKVIVLNGGSPVDKANVFFVKQSGDTGSWSVGNSTDSTGVATIQTTQGEWKGVGAPEGEYKVYITKMPDVQEDPLPPGSDSDALEKAQNAYLKKLAAAPKIVPEKLTSTKTTPLTISVKPGSTTELTVEVSEYK